MTDRPVLHAASGMVRDATGGPAAMPALAIRDLTRRLGRKTVLDHVDLDVAPGEFLALLGPSGCGKTTLLRLIAGLDGADDGRIRIAGRPVDHDGRLLVPAEARGVGMVFQSYALWPQMTVAENVAFALKRARRGPAETAARVAAALDTVGLTEHADTMPDRLSGGQRQRVALARVLAAAPALVLMDEPLANLDPHLRRGIGDEIRRLHDATGAATVYVTHDQTEAMTLADRIAVMDQGRIAQVAAPAELYDQPADTATARFVGQGAVVSAMVLRGEAAGRVPVRIGGGDAIIRAAPGTLAGPTQIVLRPEALVPAPAGTTGSLPAFVSRRTFEGGGHLLRLAAPWAGEPLLMRTGRHAPDTGETIGVLIRDGWVLPRA
ncbi:ABC transporter ATP-binding protein [Tistrella bauzanensis]|uniref:ABC transporter ATP-binding protein n=1 Tax=Tistrella TaxID=171436 RepID=UPI0031F71F2C